MISEKTRITLIALILRILQTKKAVKKTAFVLPQGLEPWTPTLRVSCSTN